MRIRDIVQPDVDHEKTNVFYLLGTDCVVSWVNLNVIYHDQGLTREVLKQLRIRVVQPHVDHEKNASNYLRTDCVASWVKQNVIYRNQVQTREVR